MHALHSDESTSEHNLKPHQNTIGINSLLILEQNLYQIPIKNLMNEQKKLSDHMYNKWWMVYCTTKYHPISNGH